MGCTKSSDASGGDHGVSRSRDAENPQTEDEQFRLLFENSLDAIVIADDEGRYQKVNTTACSLFGYSEEQMLGMSVGDLVTPDARNAAEKYQEYLRTGRETGEFTFIRGDGEIRIASYAACRLAPGRHLSILRDITKAKQHALEIEALNYRLIRSMVETHHRVKNNLQITSALVELQVETTDGNVPVSALTRIGQHVRSLATIHDLLTLQIQAGDQTGSISSHSVLERMIPLFETTTGGRPIRFEADDISLPAREGGSLTLLISEMISNAIKHGKGSIEIKFSVSAKSARLEVCDDGPGFPPEFDAKKDANTGLGLIETIGRHDLRGTLSYENRSEGGARVAITFPVPNVFY